MEGEQKYLKPKKKKYQKARIFFTQSFTRDKF